MRIPYGDIPDLSLFYCHVFTGADRSYRQTSKFNSHVVFYLRPLNILTLPTVSRWSASRTYRPLVFILQVLRNSNI